MNKNNWKKYACLSAIVIATTSLQTTSVEATKQISNQNIQIKCGCEHKQNVQKQAVQINHEQTNNAGSNKVSKPQHEIRVKTNIATPATPQSVTPIENHHHQLPPYKKADKNILPIRIIGEVIHKGDHNKEVIDNFVPGITFDLRDFYTKTVYLRGLTTTNGMGIVIPRNQNAHIPNGAFLEAINVKVPAGYKLLDADVDQYGNGSDGHEDYELDSSHWPINLRSQLKGQTSGALVVIKVEKLPAKVAAATAQLPKHNQNTKAVQTPQKPAQTKPSVVAKSVNKVPVVANKIQSTPKQNLQTPTQKTTSYVRGTNKENSNVMLEMGMGASMVLGGLVLRNKLKR